MTDFLALQASFGRAAVSVACCLPRCGLKYRDACQLSQEPLGDAEQVQDGAQLEHGLVHVSIV